MERVLDQGFWPSFTRAEFDAVHFSRQSAQLSRAFFGGFGLSLVAERATTPDPVNIGHDDQVSIRQLIEKVLEVTGADAAVEFDTSRPDGYPRSGADATRLREVTGWVPAVPLEEGLKEMVEEYERIRQR